MVNKSSIPRAIRYVGACRHCDREIDTELVGIRGELQPKKYEWIRCRNCQTIAYCEHKGTRQLSLAERNERSRDTDVQ